MNGGRQVCPTCGRLYDGADTRGRCADCPDTLLVREGFSRSLVRRITLDGLRGERTQMLRGRYQVLGLVLGVVAGSPLLMSATSALVLMPALGLLGWQGVGAWGAWLHERLSGRADGRPEKARLYLGGIALGLGLAVFALAAWTAPPADQGARVAAWEAYLDDIRVRVRHWESCLRDEAPVAREISWGVNADGLATNLRADPSVSADALACLNASVRSAKPAQPPTQRAVRVRCPVSVTSAHASAVALRTDVTRSLYCSWY